MFAIVVCNFSEFLFEVYQVHMTHGTTLLKLIEIRQEVEKIGHKMKSDS
jgi:hypothetical protein